MRAILYMHAAAINGPDVVPGSAEDTSTDPKAGALVCGVKRAGLAKTLDSVGNQWKIRRSQSRSGPAAQQKTCQGAGCGYAAWMSGATSAEIAQFGCVWSGSVYVAKSPFA